MKIVYPADRTVSIWVGTFLSEEEFELCVDNFVSPALSLEDHITSICEIAFEPQELSIQDLLNGFSGSKTFIENATRTAAARGIDGANCALVCYFLSCINAPDSWDRLKFLGSFPGQDRS